MRALVLLGETKMNGEKLFEKLRAVKLAQDEDEMI